MLTEEIRAELYRLRDEKYRDFQEKLIPTVRPGTMIGVRTPVLRTYAKQLLRRPDVWEFLEELPHDSFDENQLHAFILSELKEFERCADEVNRFLPFVDNWATCDQLSPKVFGKHHADLLPLIQRWIASGETYTVRFGIGMLMAHFLDADFDPRYPEWVAAVRSEEYYVNMMRAWYFATALAKQYDTVLPYLEQHRLDAWTNNKTVQKAVESYRVTDAQKAYLKTQRIK